MDLSAEYLSRLDSIDGLIHTKSIIEAFKYKNSNYLIKTFIENYALIHTRLQNDREISSIMEMNFVIANTKNGKFTMPRQ